MYLIIFLFLSCSNPETPNIDNKTETEKSNSDLTIRDRVGKYIGKDLGSDSNMELEITEYGFFNILLSIPSSTVNNRVVKSSINLKNYYDEKLLDLKAFGDFYDETDLAGPRRCEVTFKFISKAKVSMSFTYRNNFFGSILDKI